MPSYWAEKIQNGTNGGRENAKKYDWDYWCAQLLDQLEHHYGLEGDDLAVAKACVEEEIFIADDRHDAMVAAGDFRIHLPNGHPFSFDPCELPDGKDYEYHFIWCCYAIVWGIQQWDAAHA